MPQIGGGEADVRRVAIVMRGALDVARSSGTATAVIRLRRALADAGIDSAVFGQQRIRWGRLGGVFGRTNGAQRALADCDAVLGIDGAGCEHAESAGLPFVALVKALYVGTLRHERPLVRLQLLRSLAIELIGTREADAVIVPSQFAAGAVVRAYGADRDAVYIVPEPFDVDDWCARLPERRRSGQRVLCVAHLYPRKRIVDLIEAWPIVRAARPDARLDVVGGGPDLRMLERRARDLPGCYLHGFAPPAATLEFYARADAFCLPSAQETFGYAVVEAMASGLPVVVADSGALPELIAGAVSAAVPVGDVRALARAVLRSLDPSARAEAARRNPVRARALMPSIVTPRVLDVLRLAIQRRAAGSVSRRSGDVRYASTVARILSLLAASASAKNPPW
jgi:glycosyltransferase involved in cell wall biosynthesis